MREGETCELEGLELQLRLGVLYVAQLNEESGPLRLVVQVPAAPPCLVPDFSGEPEYR